MADPDTDDQLEALARARIGAKAGEIQNSLMQIAAGNPLGAEPDPKRRQDRIAAKTGGSAREVAQVTRAIVQATAAVEVADARGAFAPGGPPIPGGPEAIQGPTIDFVGVEFLTRGRLAANTVGRVAFRNGRAQGTGFLVAPGLFITNNHVIKTPEMAAELCVEFDYEASETGGERPVTRFGLAPERCYVSDPIDALDFTLIAIGKSFFGSKALEALGYLPLSDAPDKHMLGEIANIIQHPSGRLKQVVLRSNNLVSRDETVNVLHYVADTEPGSSGSPVCNNEWEPIALHHWGGPALEVTDMNGNPLSKDINEGLRISAIVKALRARVGSLDAASKAAISEALNRWDTVPRGGPAAPEAASPVVPGPAGAAALAAAGMATVSVPGGAPVEIVGKIGAGPAATVLPAAAASAAAAPGAAEAAGEERASTRFGDRGGYEPGFIPGFVVPLPDASKAGFRLAENSEAAEGDDPHELRYHHFSILMNAERRLAAVTAVNIDGARIVAVKREDKSVDMDPTLRDLDAEAMEASDDFQPDPRIAAGEQMGREFYASQKVPGFDSPGRLPPGASAEDKRAHARATAERTARMFQKGHIILRGDPAWGTADEARAAEADTFFYTNAAPQLGWFNQGSPVESPGMKGRLRWRALETWILRNAFLSRRRVSVFAGPVFAADDPLYREGTRVPMRFWKLAVWAEKGRLRSIALTADQRPVLETLTQGVPEAFTDREELARAAEFATKVETIEALTGLDFGAAVRRGDVRRRAKTDVAALDAALPG